MRIICPHCGERGLDEFIYYGDATPTRPDASSANAADEFYTYGYERKNIAGAHSELWYHSAGCHAWLVVSRDTRTHVIGQVELARDVALARQGDPVKAKSPAEPV